MTARALAFVVLACGALLSVSAWLTWDARLEALAVARQSSVNLTRSLVQHAEGVLDRTDILLIDLKERVEVDGVNPLERARLQNLLKATVARQPQLFDLAVYDVQGKLLVNAGATAAAPADQFAKSWFQAHAGSAQDLVHVGRPSRLSDIGEWTIPMTRRLNDAQGQFAGVVLAQLKVDYFSRYHLGFNIGPQSLIGMTTADGTLVTRRPAQPAAIGTSIADSDLYRQHYSQQRVGVMTVKSPFDALVRQYAFQHLNRYPLLIATATSEDDDLARWRNTVLLNGIVTGLLLILIATGGVRMVSRIRARTLADRAQLVSLAKVKNLEHALDAHALVSITDTSGRIIYANDRFCEISGYEREALLGRDHSILNSGYHSDAFMIDLWRTIAGGRVWHGEIRNRAKNGSFYWVSSTIVPFFDENDRPYQYVSVRTDITQRKQVESELIEARTSLEEKNRILVDIAHRDGLTGIPNRRRFDIELEQELRRAVRSQTPLAVLMIDVDWFKQFNDLYGHGAGDECLKKVATEIMNAHHRPGDLCARYGGEEFAVILSDTDLAGALAVAENIRANVARLALPHSGSIYGMVTVCVGVHALVPKRDGDSADILMRTADAWLYRAKSDGRNRVSPALAALPSVMPVTAMAEMLESSSTPTAVREGKQGHG